MENVKKKRNGFASGIGFILAAAGSAVGLGNLWSFPYKTAKYGGAAFVFVYIISVLLIGSIVMIAEIYLGKRSQANPITSYKNTSKGLGWVGLFAIVIPFFIACYYCILGGYTVKYALNSFGTKGFDNANILEAFAGNIGEVIIFTAIFLIIALTVIMAGVKGGIEKASKVLMPTLFVILVLIVVYCLCLGNGVKEGLDFYILKADFKALGFKGALYAMSQAFYSLSLGMGIMVSYGSYTGKEVKVGKSVVMISIFDTLVALLGGLAIFPAIYHFDPSMRTDGLLLLFLSLPKVFESLGVFGHIVSFLFFGMVVIAALTSVISLLEVVTQFAIQKFKIHRKKAILVVALLCFAISIPVSISLGKYINDDFSMMIFNQNWLDLFDKITNTVLMPICALASCIAVGWFIEKGSFKERLNPLHTFRALEKDGLTLGKFGKIFIVMVKYITPLLIIGVEAFGIVNLLTDPDITIKAGSIDSITGKVYTSPVYENGLGIIIVSIALLAIAVATYFIFLKNKETGYNADEIDIATEAELKANKTEK